MHDDECLILCSNRVAELVPRNYRRLIAPGPEKKYALGPRAERLDASEFPRHYRGAVQVGL